MEPFRSLFYAPNSVAIHGGHLAAEGFEIAPTTASRGLGTPVLTRTGYETLQEILLGGGFITRRHPAMFLQAQDVILPIATENRSPVGVADQEAW